MFRWAASLSTKVASSLTETFAPLFRSSLEQLQDAWRKTETEMQRVVALQSATGVGGEDDPRILLESQLVQHLNQLVEALVKEEEEQANRESDAHPDEAHDAA